MKLFVFLLFNTSSILLTLHHDDKFSSSFFFALPSMLGKDELDWMDVTVDSSTVIVLFFDIGFEEADYVDCVVNHDEDLESEYRVRDEIAHAASSNLLLI